MRVLAALGFVALIVVTAAAAQETPLPRPRPEMGELKIADPVPEAPQNIEVPLPALAIPLPRQRPAEKTAPAETTEPPKQEEPKEPRIYQTACPAVLTSQVEAKPLPPISENQCVVQSPLTLSGVMANGRMVEVTGGVVTDCSVATVLPQWAQAIDGYLFARENGRLKSIIVGTSYVCRPRNNVVGADVSEHGFANALDVIGFTLEDGRTVAVETGWTDALSNEGRLLRFAHDAACSLFTTTLGPEANALHADHLHVDMGCHGGRCVARVCE